MVLVYSTGQPLNVLSDAVAHKTAEGWIDYESRADEQFAYLKYELNCKNPSYRS